MKATIDITSKCNLRCKHCYNSEKYFKHKISELSDGELIELINKLGKDGCDEINLLGGEPLLRNNILDILRTAHKYNIFISLTTNGTLINRDKYEAIFKENLVDNLIFSLDGPNAIINDEIRGKGVFDKLMDNLDCINLWRKNYSSKMIVSISYCLITELIDEKSTTIIDICKNKNIDSISFFPIVEAGSSVENNNFLHKSVKDAHNYIDKLLSYAEKEYPQLIVSVEERPNVAEYFNIKYKNQCICPNRHIGCGVLKKCIYIKADGNILPCGFVEFKKGFEEQKNGMFKEEEVNAKNITDFNSVYKTKMFKKFIQNFKNIKANEKQDMCKKCRYFAECVPCSYQNKNGEIFAECVDVLPKLENVIEESKKWVITQKFKGGKINKLLNGRDRCTIESCYLNSNKEINYRDFLNIIVNLEKKQLVDIIRDGVEKR